MVISHTLSWHTPGVFIWIEWKPRRFRSWTAKFHFCDRCDVRAIIENRENDELMVIQALSHHRVIVSIISQSNIRVSSCEKSANPEQQHSMYSKQSSSYPNSFSVLRKINMVRWLESEHLARVKWNPILMGLQIHTTHQSIRFHHDITYNTDICHLFTESKIDYWSSIRHWKMFSNRMLLRDFIFT
jgi:hypothetical protein